MVYTKYSIPISLSLGVWNTNELFRIKLPFNLISKSKIKCQKEIISGTVNSLHVKFFRNISLSLSPTLSISFSPTLSPYLSPSLPLSPFLSLPPSLSLSLSHSLQHTIGFRLYSKVGLQVESVTISNPVHGRGVVTAVIAWCGPLVTSHANQILFTKKRL